MEEKSEYQKRLFETVLPMQCITAPETNAIADELRDFVGSIRQKTLPRVDGRQGARAVRVAQQILQSLKRHDWSLHPAHSPTIRPPHWQTSTRRREAG
jgi:predicted dehydrogenase